MHLLLNRSQVQVSEVECPETEACASDRGCVVRWFLDRFGLECNVGVADVATPMPIAWTFMGDRRDLDAAQVWVTPVDDDVFAALHGDPAEEA